MGVAVNTGGTTQVNLTCTAEATLALGAIAGLVTVTGTGVPLAGAKVTLTNALREVVATTYTVADGEFVFYDVADGAYTMTVSADGYLTAGPVLATVAVSPTARRLGMITPWAPARLAVRIMAPRL